MCMCMCNVHLYYVCLLCMCVQCVCVLCMCLCNVFVCVCNVDMYMYACVCMCTFRQTIKLFPEVLSVTADFKPVRFMDRIPIQEYMEYNIEFLLSSITQNSYNGIIACCLKKGIQHSGGGGELLPYIGYTGTCRWEGYGFQAIYSGIGSSNHRKFV